MTPAWRSAAGAACGSPRGGWSNANILNDYVSHVRLKYWEALFQAPEFTARLTSSLQKALHAKVAELGDYEFSYSNILSIQADMAAQTTSAWWNETISAAGSP